VTRLGEFSPFRQFCSWGSFLKIAEVHTALVFGLLFLQKKLCIDFVEKWIGLLFGRFFKNSSGHPLLAKEWLVRSIVKTLR
jgi:hypothetical protein